MGFDAFVSFVQKIESSTSFKVQDHISTDTAFALIEKISQLAIVIHFIEGLYVMYLCSKLKLKFSNTLSWFFMTFIAGLPMTQRVMNFVKIQNESKKHD